MLLLLASLALADDAPEARERVFMPALELGILWHEDEDLRPGPMFRTSVEYRLDQVRAPFLELSYDAATARIRRRDSTGAERLTATAAFHDLILGPGMRVGPDSVQFLAAVLGGVQIAEIPFLEARRGGFVVDTRTAAAALLTAGVGVEWYLDENTAITLDVSGRARFGEPDGLGPLAGALTLGATTGF